VLAALATIPRREAFLERVLGSLRPQVDRIHVYLNGWQKPPKAVLELADRYEISAENEGAERKLFWAESWDGLYFSCDDDIVYPRDYVAVMREAVERWRGRALVTSHGRSYVPDPRSVHHVLPQSLGLYSQNVRPGRWINHGGTGVMAWDTATVRVPATYPERNLADLQVAMWAQDNEVPTWLVPHEAHWFESLAMLDPLGLFKQSQSTHHARRTEWLRRQAQKKPWQVFEVPE
jgi:hypothetical protein